MSDGNTNIGIIPSLIAGASVVISVLALFYSNRAFKKAKQAQDISNELQKQNNSLQERMVLLEETRQQDAVIEANRADLIAILNRFGKSQKLEIENIGQSAAKNVKAFIAGTSIIELGNVFTDNGEHNIIGPNSKVSYTVVIVRGFRPPFEFSVTWEDDSGIPGNYETTLT